MGQRSRRKSKSTREPRGVPGREQQPQEPQSGTSALWEAPTPRSCKMRTSQDRQGDGAGDPRWWTVPRRGGRPERRSEWRRGRGCGEGRGDRRASRVLAGGDGKEVLRAAEGFFYDVGRDLNIFSC